MNNVYNDPAYASVRENMHKRLTDMREKYGDSDENDKMHLERYLESRKKRNK